MNGQSIDIDISALFTTDISYEGIAEALDFSSTFDHDFDLIEYQYNPDFINYGETNAGSYEGMD